MAPEQAAGRKDLTPALDVYALGCIFYEALTGRPPIQAPTPLDTLLLVLEQEPVPPRLLNPGVPRELEAVCLKCLSKAPASRYSSAADLAGDLEGYLRGDPVSAQSSGLAFFLDRTFRETHHAVVLEDWGVLWMWHSLWTLILCTVTQIMAWEHVERHDAYLILWTVGLIGWGTIFWKLRKRAGPVRFVERQIAHAWAAGIAASIGMFVIEVLLHQPVLTFSPLLAVAAGMIFLFKAGVLAGLFYIASAAMFATAVLMALFPQVGILLFGIVTALCFFVPGLKYHLQRRKKNQNADFADQRG
jgi:serine/threonine-protein kinase